MDIRMPDMNGVELLTQLRAEKLPVHVIVLSGYDDFEHVRAMAVLGIEDYLLKPVNEQTLLRIVKDTVRRLDAQKRTRLHEQISANALRENMLNRWLYGSIREQDLEEHAAFLGYRLDAAWYCPCLLQTFGPRALANKLEIARLCMGLLEKDEGCYFAPNDPGDVIALFYGDQERRAGAIALLRRCAAEVTRAFQEELLVAAGEDAVDCWSVAASFRALRENPRYLAPEEDRADEEASPLAARLIQYVREHYAEDLSLKQLARQFKGSAAYIGQVFKRDMGVSFSNYLKKVRLDRACALLRESDLPVRDIAKQVGFQNENYFFNVFHRAVGISPAEYRRQF